jgi:anti-sigma factor RsiW
MPCEPYQNALTEAAASGLEPQGELRAHLAACPACRATLSQEQSLFSSIDTGLHAAVNVEVPASLLPRVRTQIAEEPAVTRGWIPSWLTVAAAAAVLVAFIATRPLWRTGVVPAPVHTASNVSSPAASVLPPQDQNLNAAHRAVTNSVPTIQAAATHNPPPRGAMPEVLVPRDQEALLVSYAEQWGQRKRAPLVAANFDSTNLSLLQISPIQIDQLDVKLMTEEHAQ